MPPLTSGVDDTAATSGRVLDPADFTFAQLAGHTCVLCHKRSPRTLLGTFPDGMPALVCDDHDIESLLNGGRA